MMAPPLQAPRAVADLYALLGVAADASQEEIKRAYRRRARELHPDAGGDEEAFKQVTHAYDVLSDPQRRARYDRFGDEGRGGAGGDAFGFGFGGLGDVIEAFFGGGGGGFGTSRAAATQPGRDVLVALELDLEEVATGAQRHVEVDVAVVCDACAGSGSRSGTGLTACVTCGGRGQVQRIVRSAFGQLATARPCPDCSGSGRVIADPCPQCAGEGRRREHRRILVEVPAGVDAGDRLRISGQGEAGWRGGASGDLFAEVRIRPHEVFTRDGRDLQCDVTVPMVIAALGARLEVPTLNGDTVDVDLPPGTQSGEVLTVRRAGLPRRGGSDPGALHVRVGVETPRAASAEEEDLLRQLAALRGEEAPPAGRGLFRRLREAFR